jgi:hypothetical protein
MTIDIHPHVVSTDTKRYPNAPVGGHKSDGLPERPVSAGLEISVEQNFGERRPKSCSSFCAGIRVTNVNRDYLLEFLADSLCGAFFCNTRTRWWPDAGIETLPPSTISRAVILRP